MIVRDARPENHARVLVRVAGWVNTSHFATAHVTPDGLRWRFDTFGWQDAQPGDEWCYATEQEVKP